MNIVLGLIIFFVVFSALDVVCYCHAKFPERMIQWWSPLPGSGFVALLKFGRE